MIINKHLKGLLNKAPVTSKNDLKGLMLVMLVMPPTHPWNFRNLLTWLGNRWKEYLCQKCCCTILLCKIFFFCDNMTKIFSFMLRCVITSRTFLANI